MSRQSGNSFHHVASVRAGLAPGLTSTPWQESGRTSHPLRCLLAVCRQVAAWGLLALFAAAAALCSPAAADEFQIEDDVGNRQKWVGRIVGEGEGVLAIERASGRIELVRPDSIKERTPGPDPEPWTSQKMVEQIKRQFKKEKPDELLRFQVAAPYVITVILGDKLKPGTEPKVDAFLNKASRFFQTIDDNVEKFLTGMKAEPKPPRFPLPVLIFESDRDFNDYANRGQGKGGLSASNILGFYSPKSNELVLRMGECANFAVPLHEAVHQQYFNRGVAQRLAQIPVWFVEGMAMAFEGDGEKITTTPTRINDRLARGSLRIRGLDWDLLTERDGLFHANTIAGLAYTEAWALHWMAVYKYKDGYAKFLAEQGKRAPLDPPLKPEERNKQFLRCFGRTPKEMEADLASTLNEAIKKQKKALNPENPPGTFRGLKELGQFDILLEGLQGGGVQASGQFRNVSTWRDLAFFILVIGEKGDYTHWYFPNVKPQKLVKLPKQRMVDIRQSGSDRFGIFIRSAFVGSDEAKEWAEGNFPKLSYDEDQSEE